MRERRNDLALLAAIGWTDRQLGRLITTEGALMGLAGSLSGAALGLAIAAVLQGSAPTTLWLLAGLTAGIGTLVSTLASLAAALSLRRLVGTPSLTQD
jgi:putative ABC transport system permease protein